MKVLFLTNIPSPYRVNFFNELSKYCDLTVVFEKKSSKSRDTNWVSDERASFKSVYLNGLRIRNKLVYSKDLIRISKDKWDLVIIGNYMIPSAIYLNIRYSIIKKPFLIEADGGLVKNDTWIMKTIKKALISKASEWLTSGPETTKYFVHYGANVKRCYEYPFSSIRQSEISNSLSVCKEKRLEAREYLGYDNSPVILAVGQFIHRKGFDILLKAMAKTCSHAKLVFVGGVPTDEYLNLCKELRLQNVVFEGFKTKKELERYYQAADIFVLPTREDIWGLVINEAMAYGLPIITSNRCVAGLELISDDKNGYIFKNEDADELANCINKLVTDENLREYMCQNNLVKIQNYTIETMAFGHKEIFNQILTKREK